MSLRHFVVIALISAAAFMSVLSAREPEPAMSASVASPGAWLRVQGDGRYSAGQPTAEQLQTLSAHGIGVVIDLRADAEQAILAARPACRRAAREATRRPIECPG